MHRRNWTWRESFQRTRRTVVSRRRTADFRASAGSARRRIVALVTIQYSCMISRRVEHCWDTFQQGWVFQTLIIISIRSHSLERAEHLEHHFLSTVARAREAKIHAARLKRDLGVVGRSALCAEAARWARQGSRRKRGKSLTFSRREDGGAATPYRWVC